MNEDMELERAAEKFSTSLGFNPYSSPENHKFIESLRFDAFKRGAIWQKNRKDLNAEVKKLKDNLLDFQSRYSSALERISELEKHYYD